MRLLFILLLVLLTACQTNEPSVREIDMYNTDSDMVGTATFSEHPDGVQIEVKVEGLTPGLHGIHLHENPTCKGEDFKSAGNHFNPEGKKHGLMNPDGNHLGDLPNVEADSSGAVDTELMLADATLLEGKKSILSEEGTSLVIHKDQDDGVTQPGGDSGARIMCGELKADLIKKKRNNQQILRK
ncbi:superoxide dismutase family protein [Virgibacillus alimentarius]|uniref:superoxide dismutase family protein n=1 Tax=Virgibacillus alimentarius TaxID=698769 RepID=UPI000A7DD674|nr:superoxide dismutase family protein [Virgibacillus alimentarius]